MITRWLSDPPAFLAGRRLVLLLLAATALLAVPLFFIFPPESPLAALGGGQVRGPQAPIRAGSGSGVLFVTLNPGDTLDMSPGPANVTRASQVLRRVGRTSAFRAAQPGHALVTVGSGRAQKTVSVFVSPFPSVQVGRMDVDWYKTQYGTGIANCGPALVAMAILWAQGRDFAVDQIRQEIGWPYEDGSTSYDNLRASLARHGVRYASPILSGARALFSLLDRGHIAFILIQSGLVARATGNPATNPVGRYYDDDAGHYVIVKGYSLDHRYLVVYDPYPADWESNSLRYGDGVTQIGKDRYYATNQVLTALKTPEVIEIFPGR